jgi:Type ISP C-terminal specificity domain
MVQQSLHRRTCQTCIISEVLWGKGRFSALARFRSEGAKCDDWAAKFARSEIRQRRRSRGLGRLRLRNPQLGKFFRSFWEELETPGPRVPITKSSDLFFEAVQQGKRLIWLHTYAARMRGAGRGDEVPQGAARCSRAVSDAPSAYPEDFAYSEGDRKLRVGNGLFSPVSPEVWASSVLRAPRFANDDLQIAMFDETEDGGVEDE